MKKMSGDEYLKFYEIPSVEVTIDACYMKLICPMTCYLKQRELNR